MTVLTINNKQYQLSLPDDTPLLWAVRDQLGMTGTKFGCGMALCGACTMHLDGEAIRSCVTPISAAINKKSPPLKRLSKIRLAWRFRTLDGSWCAAMRLLSVWTNHVGYRFT